MNLFLIGVCYIRIRIVGTRNVEDYIKEIDALRAKNSKLEQQNQALRDDLRSYREKPSLLTQ